jgi:hypothetical protein
VFIHHHPDLARRGLDDVGEFVVAIVDSVVPS